MRRALISVWDKRDIVEFAMGIQSLGYEIIASGGTASLLKSKGMKVKEIGEFTGFPEILDGRVKTLHPMVYGGILALREKESHMDQLKIAGIEPIDMVVVNLYPFEEIVKREDSSFDDALENIDIGGPTLIRAAAKNFSGVIVIVDPEDYGSVLDELRRSGDLPYEMRFKLARKAFQLTARYDGAISNYFGSIEKGGKRQHFPETFTVQFKKVQDLRYGENPHQKGSFYRDIYPPASSIATAEQLHGKELSYTNILDLDAALELVKEFDEVCAVIIKHTNPCGAAISTTSLKNAYIKARECDPVSAYGGIVGFNREVDEETASEVISTFIEAIIAPGFTEKALDILRSKKNLRILKAGPLVKELPSVPEMRKVSGGILIQERDMADTEKWQVVTKKSPTEEEKKALLFAWKICKHVKSNAIVYSYADRIIGVGAGQMSRIDSARFAMEKARFPLKGSVMASDAFFPFRDVVDLAASAGVSAIIQPGGSIRDEEVIRAADEHGIAMVFTGMRHFKH